MIGKLKGILSEVDKNIGLIETSGGVFYQVYLTPSLISRTSPSSPITLYTYLQVRDDALVLFGFQTKEEHDFFQMLLTVPSVGPKTAFNIISLSNIDDIIEATKKNDLDYFTKIPGLGKKTGLKIILELSQKLKTEFKFQDTELSEDDKTVVDALVSLGYKVNEIKTKLLKIEKTLSVEEKIKHLLRK